MDDILPWLGYLAVYVAGGLAGFFGAALFCGAAQSALRAENEQLREKLRELEGHKLPDDAHAAYHGRRNGLAA